MKTEALAPDEMNAQSAPLSADVKRLLGGAALGTPG